VGDPLNRRQVVADDHHRLPLAGQVAHDGEHLVGHLRVEGARRLVEQDRRRVNRERPGDRNTLLLPAGELGRLRVELVPQPDPFEQRLGHRFRLRPGIPESVARAREHVLQRRHVRKEIELLEHHPDPPAELQQLLLVRRPAAGEVHVADRDRSLLERLQPIDAP
jgi:hypothetical protein